MNALSETTEPTEYEGTWAEIQQHADKLDGRRLRVIVLPETTLTKKSPSELTPEEWVAALHDFVEKCSVPGVVVDDSREGISMDEEERWR